MKKSLLFVAAAAALMLTACSSENDVLQNAPQTQETAAKALDFDVYMPQAVTRAGYAGVMTTDKLKTNTLSETVGFGVFAFHHDASTYTTETPANNTPDFMYNEHVIWDGGWKYSPLKYWPNETDIDSQDPAAAATDSRVDRLSFFAYAPYVNLTTSGTMTTNRGSSTTVGAYVDNAGSPTGIIAISNETKQQDPYVEWKYSTTLDNNVDLLWGVAPAGMSYQSVNPTNPGAGDPGYVNKPFGYPLTDMLKPDKDQKMKFLFQHALSRIGLTVVSAIDQIAAGDDGNVFDATENRILIKSVEIRGDFGKQGVLNLNNVSPNVNKANWIAESIDKSSKSDVAALFTIDGAGGNLAPELRYVDTQISAVNSDINNFAQINKGVREYEQTLLAGGADPSKKVTNPSFAFGKTLYVFDSPDYVIAKASAPTAKNIYKKNAAGDYTKIYTAGGAAYKFDGSEISGAVTDIVTLSGTDAPSTAEVQVGGHYWTVNATDANTFDIHEVTGSAKTLDGSSEYLLTDETRVTATYTSGDYYTSLTPRYFMVIPTGDTPIKVKINYAVVTKDAKLTGKVSNVDNEITKEISVNLESGKSYNLKLILGLTSVKLDATVGIWQVADDAEIYLPKNNE